MTEEKKSALEIFDKTYLKLKPNRYYLIRWDCSGFMPIEIPMFYTRFKFLMNLYAKYYRKKKHRSLEPLCIVNPDLSMEWLVTWTDVSNKDPRESMPPVDYIEGHKDVKAIIRGPQIKLSPTMHKDLEKAEKIENRKAALALLDDEQLLATIQKEIKEKKKPTKGKIILP